LPFLRLPASVPGRKSSSPVLLFTLRVRFPTCQLLVRPCNAGVGRVSILERAWTAKNLSGLPRDEDGSAKIAMIGMDRSIVACAVLSPHVPAHAEAALSTMLTLARLRTAVEREFPGARGFVRPGFDTHVFPGRGKGDESRS